MARRLTTLARYINENWPAYKALTVPGYAGDRAGTKLLVARCRDDAVVKSHNSSETYRKNREVEEWIEAVEAGRLSPEPLNRTVEPWPAHLERDHERAARLWGLGPTMEERARRSAMGFCDECGSDTACDCWGA